MIFLWCVLWNHAFKLTPPILSMDLYLQGIEKQGEVVAIDPVSMDGKDESRT